ncbi:sensor histidine kinase [Enterococcus sp. LJL128]
MDWLDEQLQRIRLTNKKLTASLSLYIFTGIILAVFAYMVTVSICVGWEKLLLDEADSMDSYIDMIFYSHNAGIPQQLVVPVTILQLIRHFSVILYAVLAIVWISRKFYKDKILQPLIIMNETIEGISRKDLSIACYYKSGDEFERICSGLDQMRVQLIQDQQQIIRTHEEQRQLNSIFAHDVRTPLAVIQSNVELIRKFHPLGTLTEQALNDSLDKIGRNVQRLNDFTFTMQEIQKLDEIDLNKRQQHTQTMIQTIQETGNAIVTKEFRLIVSSQFPKKINCDLPLIMQVVENLLTNADRFAKNIVSLTIQFDADFLYLFVQDDGAGFSKEDIQHAATPYYSKDKQEHFGMGLTICKTLTKKHGGILRLSNGVNGGAVISAAFNTM